MNRGNAETGNDFIGIDIDVDPPPDREPSSKQRVSSKKRPRTTPRARASTSTDAAAAAATSTSMKRRPNKPKPPQNPPPSLVSLLQKDASVRSYFQSLQENLDYDVEKWKHEAAVWKRLATSSSPTAVPVSTIPKTKTKRDEIARGKTSLEYKGGATKNTQTSPLKRARPKTKTISDDLILEGGEDDAIPITDEVLFGDLSDGDSSQSSSSSSSSCIRTREHNVLTDDRVETKRNNQLVETTSDVDAERQSRRRRRSHNILENLKLAKKCLDLLGISLVEVEVKTTMTTTPPPPTTTVTTLLPSNDNDMSNHQQPHSFEDIHIPTSCDNNCTTDHTSPIITKMERILHRQSDEKVAAEMMASLRTLIKTSSFIGSASHRTLGKSTSKADQDGDSPSDDDNDTSLELDQTNISNDERMHRTRLRRYYHPFCSGGVLHLPNVYYSKHQVASSNEAVSNDEQNSCSFDHPAAVGLRHLVEVLIIMDAYCGDDLDDDEWRAVFAEDGHGITPMVEDDELLLHEDMTILQIGMRNRYRLTERILSSLDVEITRVWALTDRATNLATSSIHFHPADVLDMNDPENENIQNNFYGAKNYSRLVMLEERVAHARIATLVHRRRGNLQLAAELVVGYIISTAPAVGAEQYPKLPPLLSLCVLEALLAPENYIPEHFSVGDDSIREKNAATRQGVGWFRACIQDVFTTRSCSDSILLRALAYPIHMAVRLWKERQYCADDRIRDTATVELAAFDRILRLDDADWLSDPTTETMTIEHMTRSGILTPLSTPRADVHGIDDLVSSELKVVSVISMTVLLLTLGDVDEVLRLSEAIMSGMNNSHNDETGSTSYLFLLPGCCVAYSNIMCRRWESMKLGNTSGRQTAAAFTIEDKFSPILDSILQDARPDDWRAIDTLVQCCVVLGDGRNLLKLAHRVVPTIMHAFMAQNNNTASSTERKLMSRTLMSLVDSGEVPTVRVINLKRRPDRKYDFLACAVNKEQLIVIQGPTKLRRKDQIAESRNPKTSRASQNNDETEYRGHYAFDGKCSRDDLEKQLRQQLDGKGTVTDFVSMKWRPSDLKAFDEHARGDFELVHTSMTEKACALSHIAR